MLRGERELLWSLGRRIRNVFRKIGCVLDRICNTVWIITREENLSLAREPSYLWSPVSIKVYPWIKQCLWIKGWFRPNYTLYEKCLEKVNEHHIEGGQNLPGSELMSRYAVGHGRRSLGIAPRMYVVGLKKYDWFLGVPARICSSGFVQ